ncbi:MAG: glycosyltransferase [Kiritimatiellia bacterium]
MQLSVLMAVHNGGEYLATALESISRQTFAPDEVVVVDDASEDDTADILRQYQRQLPLRILANSQRLGLTNSLRRGWTETRGEYVARMDADDVSLPRRFARQMARMVQDPSLGFCGTWARAFSGRSQPMRKPTRMEDLKAHIIWGNPFIHSSVMLKKSRFEAAKLAYDSAFPVAQDFDLWDRALEAGLSAANLPEYLIAYRVHENNVTATRGRERIEAVMRIYKRQLLRMGMVASDIEVQIHRQIAELEVSDEGEHIKAALAWLEKLVQSIPVGKQGVAFWSALRWAWYSVCYRNMILHNSQHPCLYWKGQYMDPLGWRRWLLRAALGKKCVRQGFEKIITGDQGWRR